MSRIGKQPISVPQNVTVDIADNLVSVKGPKGQLNQQIADLIVLSRVDDKLIVARKDDSNSAKSLHGLSRTLIANMIKGVSEGWSKDLEIVGTGYRAALQGAKLNLSLGYSHPVIIDSIEGITFNVAGNKISIQGIDKQLVGEVAAKIRLKRKPEPYKGKGVRYSGEVIRRKAGKAKKAGK